MSTEKMKGSKETEKEEIQGVKKVEALVDRN